MDESRLAELLQELAKDVVVMQTTQKHTITNVDKLTTSTEHLLKALSSLGMMSTKLDNIEKRLDLGSPTIKECDQRGKTTELKVERLERVVFGGLGLVLLGVLAKLMSLANITIPT